MAEDRPETICSDEAFPDILMPVHPGVERGTGVIQVYEVKPI